MLSRKKGLDIGRFLYSNLIKYKYPIFFIFLIVVRLYLLTFNHGEFTDTYDILYRAKELLDFQYSPFEERMPGYPFLIALGMPFIDGLLWGKILVMLASAGIFYLSFRIYDILFSKEKGRFLLLVLLLVNPFFLFWSIRPLTETIFIFFALLAFFVFFRKQTRYTNVLLGLIIGMAVMVRYEGCFLLPAIMVPLLIRKEWRRILIISSGFLLAMMPWFIRNKLVFEQFFYLPWGSGKIRKFLLVDLFTSGKIHLPNQEQIGYLITNSIETIFIMGFPIAFIWIFRGMISALRDREKRLRILSLMIFLILQSLLYLGSPAAGGKRLIIQVPFFLIFFVFGLERPYAFRKRTLFISSLVLLATFLVGINKYRSLIANHYPREFLILGTLIVVGFYGSSYLRKKEKYFKLLIAAAIICVSLPTSRVLKGRQYSYPTLMPAAKYAYSQLKGTIAYGSVSSLAMPKGITGWYLDEKGIPYPHGDKHEALVLTDEEQIEWLEANKIDYVMWHNERKEGAKFTVLNNPQYSLEFLPLRAYGSISNTTRIYEYGIPEEFYEIGEGRMDFKDKVPSLKKVINAYFPFRGQWKMYSMKIRMSPPVHDQIVRIYVNDYLVQTLRLYPKQYDYKIGHLDFPLIVTKNRIHSSPNVYPLAGIVEIKFESNIPVNFNHIEFEPEYIFTKFIGLYSRTIGTFGHELFPLERVFNIANKEMVENNSSEEFAQSSIVLPYYENTPLTKAIGIISSTGWSRNIPQGTVVAKMKIIDIEDNIYEFDIREGIDTAEMSYNENTKHNRASQNKWGDYYSKFNFKKPIRLKEIQIDYVYSEGALRVQSLVLLRE